ncbi:MAG: DUF924 domain-containing protein [Sandaracinaceae bacterium]|nr:DUF924 domain-containing protein [Sandaracinaceae bacterium]
MDEKIAEILSFWFDPPPEGEERPQGMELWFAKSAATDRKIERKFGRTVERAKSGALDAWAETPKGRLALIVLLDQFNRNVHRETPEMFAGDEKALALCLDGLDEGMDRSLNALERAFFYMPCMHAEDVDMQLTSVEVFAELLAEAPPEHKKACEAFLQHAEKHRDVVERFERFPHRNAILDRSSSPEESAFLQHSGLL